MEITSDNLKMFSVPYKKLIFAHPVFHSSYIYMDKL